MKQLFNTDDDFLARWLSGDLSDRELEAFKASPDYHIYEKIVSTSDQMGTGNWNKDQIWKNVLYAKKEKGEESQKTRKLTPRWISIAAVLLVLVLIPFVLKQSSSTVDFQTGFGENRTLELPDGSLVHLNAESKLDYDEKTFQDTRVLNLNGEAFFEVKKGESFTVLTKNGDVRVLGTQFNVKSRDQILNVGCYSGKVGVSFNDFKEEEVLTKGDRIRSMAREITEKTYIDSTLIRPFWRDGKSRFYNENFSQVINELERQFDISINATSDVLKIQNYSGGFDHDDLDKALTIVFSSINYEFEVNGRVVSIKKKQ